MFHSIKSYRRDQIPPYQHGKLNRLEKWINKIPLGHITHLTQFQSNQCLRMIWLYHNVNSGKIDIDFFLNTEWSLFVKIKVLITQGWFVVSLVEIDPVIPEKKINMWKVYRHTDDGQQAIKKAHLSFQLRWAYDTCIIIIEDPLWRRGSKFCEQIEYAMDQRVLWL